MSIEPMESIRKIWRRRVVAEYSSAAVTAELLHQALILGLSPDTLETCHRIVSDEIAHAELSRDVFLAAGGGEDEVIPIARDGLLSGRGPDDPLELQVLATVADVFCCGETVAVPLFRAIREPTVEPVAVAALDRILRDESIHRAFGWDTLDELLELLGEPGHAWVREHAPGYMNRIREAYRNRGGTQDICSPTEVRWGRMEPRRYSEITAVCIAEVITPRFESRVGSLAT
jgi:hypothetical protein